MPADPARAAAPNAASDAPAEEGVAAQIEALRSAGIHVADSPAELGTTMLKAMKG